MNDGPEDTAPRAEILRVFLVLLIYFVISLLTNILGPIIPEIIRSFSLSLTAAALLPFAFFIAYGLTSIPAGILIETYFPKKQSCFRRL